MRYLIDEQGTDTAQSLAMYRVVLPWAARRGDRAAFVVHADVYDDRAALARVLALAAGEGTPTPRAPDELRYAAVPDARFVAVMLDQRPPDRGASGELSPAADVEIYAGERRIYGCFDYGRVQLLELDDEELADLRRAFDGAGLDPGRIILPPSLR